MFKKFPSDFKLRGLKLVFSCWKGFGCHFITKELVSKKQNIIWQDK